MAPKAVDARKHIDRNRRFRGHGPLLQDHIHRALRIHGGHAPGNGMLLTVVESGFDKVPPQRQLEAFRMNNQGWAAQLGHIAKHAAA